MSLVPHHLALSLLAVVGALFVSGAEADPRPARSSNEASDTIPLVVPNDNRRPAGVRRGDVVSLHLVARRARWFPESQKKSSIVVEAFGESGRAPRIPAPLIRVPAGATIAATIRNAIPDSAITVFGLQTRPISTRDSILIPPGETRTVTFPVGAPGTYLYYATNGVSERDVRERDTLGGAFVVDSAGARTDDRIFVINIWGDLRGTHDYQNALTINGLSWPHSERMSATVGDSVRWRIVNASTRVHPMHMHGFYFRIDSKGGPVHDTLYTPAQRRLSVTEDMFPGQTMSMVWTPDRPGNWLLHCHLAFHVVPESARLQPAHMGSHDALELNPDVHMSGLIVGISVKPNRGWTESPRTGARKLRLFVHEGTRRGISPRSMSYVLQHGDSAPQPDSLEAVGSTLVVTRGEPTDVTVINRLKEPTGVHWHGIELESYSDGVPGWSGFGARLAPLIAPGDSFVARLTLPRAGTFMYHTHLGDLQQLSSGLYGAIVVLEPGQVFDPRTDHVYVAAWDGLEGPDQPPKLVVNGDTISAPKEMALGVKHRIRLINISPAPFAVFTLHKGSTLVRWRALAKDGADLPPHVATLQPARRRVTVGEAYDFEFEPTEAGEYRLAVVGLQGELRWSQQIIVR